MDVDGQELPPVSSLIPPEEWYEPWIRAGLYIGAAFQLVCLLAVLILPETGSGTGLGRNHSDGDCSATAGTDHRDSVRHQVLEEDSSSADEMPVSATHRSQSKFSKKKLDKKKKRQ